MTHYARRRKTGEIGAATLLRRAQGEGSVTETGYRKIVVDGVHLFEHRHVVERMLGRALLPNENVHHRNGDKLDNDPDNLEVWIAQQPAGQRATDLVEYAIMILRRYPEEAAIHGVRLVPLESAEASELLRNEGDSPSALSGLLSFGS